jgi:hypothetical protein
MRSFRGPATGIVLSVCLLWGASAGFGQYKYPDPPSPTAKPTLKQEREEKIRDITENVKKLGSCLGYFDINYKAAEVLETGYDPSTLPVSREEARRFLTSLPAQVNMVMSVQHQMLDVAQALAGAGGQTLPVSQSQISDLFEQSVKRGEQSGKGEYEQSFVYQRYNECIKISPPSKAASGQSVDSMIDDILKDKELPQKPLQIDRQMPPAPNLAAVVTASEIEGVRAMIRKCWSTQGGARGQNMIVTLVVQMNQDATPVRVEVKDVARYNSDPAYRFAADAAHRAIMNPRCQPWPLSPEKFNAWRFVTFNFDPRDY